MAITTYTFPTISVGAPVGGATAANQLTQIGLETQIEANTASIDSKIPPLGQDTMANSLPVVIASDQSAVPVSISGSVPVTGPLTDAQLRATPVPVSGPLTDAQLRATPVPVSGTVSTGGLTDAELRASPVPTIDTFAVVDQIDTTPLLDVSSTNIPASSSNPVQIVASLASNVRKVVSVEDIGEFIGLYTGGVGVETLACILPLGGGEINVQIPSGTRVSLRHMKNTAITSDFIAINFLG